MGSRPRRKCVAHPNRKHALDKDLNDCKTGITPSHAIKRLFILPIARHCPTNMLLHEWLQEAFHVSERTITSYFVLNWVKFTACEILQGAVFDGSISTTVRMGEVIMAREDMTMPDRIDIEVWRGQDISKHSKVYRVDGVEWRRLKKELKPFFACQHVVEGGWDDRKS